MNKKYAGDGSLSAENTLASQSRSYSIANLHSRHICPTSNDRAGIAASLQQTRHIDRLEVSDLAGRVLMVDHSVNLSGKPAAMLL